MRLRFVWLLALLLATTVNAQPEPVSFIVTITNMAGIPLYSNFGVADMPVASAEIGPALPGAAYEFAITAQPGELLFFATMLAESNDLFFAPDVNGVALYDSNGNPINGEVTDQIGLWDAGTEMNQPIGEGDQQAPRQSALNSGADENGVVQRVDGMADYPIVGDLIRVSISSPIEGEFIVQIVNTSFVYAETPTAITPVVWVVTDDQGVFFTPDEPDRGAGLEALAEDGNAEPLASGLAGTDFIMPLTAVVWAIHESTVAQGPFFMPGEADRGDGLEGLAEDGTVSQLTRYLEGTDFADWGVASIPDMEAGSGPLIPGNFYTIFVEVTPGQRLSFVTRFDEGNDLFFAPDEHGIPLFTADGQPIAGSVTHGVYLWDAGTEVNEAPGTGMNQGPRQPEPNTGDAENGLVRRVDDGYAYPPVPTLIRITLEPNQ